MKAGRTRVLVVEDEQDIAGLLKHALEREGAMEVETAGSGDSADLIVLDVNLPVLSGVEVCRILRSSCLPRAQRKRPHYGTRRRRRRLHHQALQPSRAGSARSRGASPPKRWTGYQHAGVPRQTHCCGLRRRGGSRRRRAGASHPPRVRAAASSAKAIGSRSP
jgi:hypothetical protein